MPSNSCNSKLHKARGTAYLLLPHNLFPPFASAEPVTTQLQLCWVFLPLLSRFFSSRFVLLYGFLYGRCWPGSISPRPSRGMYLPILLVSSLASMSLTTRFCTVWQYSFLS
ncbi:uncharacterized protein BDW43DRAFT_208841 [Aspergillus alliaceus]|uniref:uncharacterized protein n=1 Tax=Petromyces alliaceus TaxID=209559 RepID=UPI0012A61DDF|nr:uncharacterized protein BDW43DRAFT_208841 [Aspergillus alliaceus]KAB8228837.1 hypothetical protein BDW43DRAFT_208841 [Aspergillus alliaceus]